MARFFAVLLTVLLAASTHLWVTVLGLTASQRTFLLNRHNQMRGSVSPSAANMRQLVWDSKLERVARAYAEKCVWDHNPRRSEDYQAIGGAPLAVGENLHANTNVDATRVLQTAMNNFFDERAYYNYQTSQCSKPPCGHYTQVVWATSTAVGCAIHRCNRISGTPWARSAYMVVCNYSPSGNWVGEKPYVAGTPCSRCPSDAQRCVRGLCAASASPSTASTPAPSVPSRNAGIDVSRLVALENKMRAAESRLAELSKPRPSAHLDGGRSAVTPFDSGVVANFWTVDGKRSHLFGGFSYRNGELIVPYTGYYYVYAQLWHVNGEHVRHFLYAGSRRLAVGASASGKSQTTWAGGVFRLTAGEALKVIVGRAGAGRKYSIWPGGAHTYFGAFKM